ncbi:Hsp33 family molecular chaperone HslO [Alkanindiges illinoisensis]|uniref:Hsp33 family molecular chaperone HslO n=1 Tax=Alkanindiges illinoisensis TaxID=197183 RepID=UPI0004797102|nr:Hsp33 family molecular chaperone HslO [Alkanindiges illinoisensis]
MTDIRQRFFIEHSPVRGEVVHLAETLQTILKQRDYPKAIELLLGELLAGSALLASTLKIKGRLSLQIQGSGSLKWAMAECNHLGELRALAEWNDDPVLLQADNGNVALGTLKDGVLFINIEPEHGERYQGIVPLEAESLAGCLTQYYDLSAQIPTRLALACDGEQAGGLLIQLLPRNDEEETLVDEDLWPRLTLLTNTLKADELIYLPSQEVLYRLYNEEEVRLPEQENLSFGCTCSRERCEQALRQVGQETVQELLAEQNEIKMDCQFCNAQYRFGPEQALGLFGIHVS